MGLGGLASGVVAAEELGTITTVSSTTSVAIGLICEWAIMASHEELPVLVHSQESHLLDGADIAEIVLVRVAMVEDLVIVEGGLIASIASRSSVSFWHSLSWLHHATLGALDVRHLWIILLGLRLLSSRLGSSNRWLDWRYRSWLYNLIQHLSDLNLLVYPFSTLWPCNHSGLIIS